MKIIWITLLFHLPHYINKHKTCLFVRVLVDFPNICNDNHSIRFIQKSILSDELVTQFLILIQIPQSYLEYGSIYRSCLKWWSIY